MAVRQAVVVFPLRMDPKERPLTEFGVRRSAKSVKGGEEVGVEGQLVGGPYMRTFENFSAACCHNVGR
jgi:hypothetical protein